MIICNVCEREKSWDAQMIELERDIIWNDDKHICKDCLCLTLGLFKKDIKKKTEELVEKKAKAAKLAKDLNEC